MYIMFQQRLPRCTCLCTEQSKFASTCSFRLAISANVIYDVGVSTSGEPALVVFTVDIVVAIMLFVFGARTFLFVLLMYFSTGKGKLLD